MAYFGVDILSFKGALPAPIILGRPYIVSFYEHQEFF